MNFSKDFCHSILDLIDNVSSYPDKVRGAYLISNSSLFMLGCLFVASRGSERGWFIR